MLPRKHIQCNQMVRTMFCHTPPSLIGIGTMVMKIIIVSPSSESAPAEKEVIDGVSNRKEVFVYCNSYTYGAIYTLR